MCKLDCEAGIAANEDGLRVIIQDPIRTPTKRFPGYDDADFVRGALELIVTKRWNSYYPSVFNSHGGGYVLKISDSVASYHLFLIDPGFSFLKGMRDLHLYEGNIDGILISHHHPDHIASFSEIITMLHERRMKATVYLNPTSYEACLPYGLGGGKIDLLELEPDSNLQIYLSPDRSYGLAQVRLRTLKAHHREVGGRSAGLSFVFDSYWRIRTRGTKSTRTVKRTVALTCDTDLPRGIIFDRASIPAPYVESEVLVGHLGSITRGSRGNHHLGIGGLELLVQEAKVRGSCKLVVVSEFGCEMAPPCGLGKMLGHMLENVDPLVLIDGLLEYGKEERERRKENAIGRLVLLDLYDRLQTREEKRLVGLFSRLDRRRRGKLKGLTDFLSDDVNDGAPGRWLQGLLDGKPVGHLTNDLDPRKQVAENLSRVAKGLQVIPADFGLSMRFHCHKDSEVVLDLADLVCEKAVTNLCDLVIDTDPPSDDPLKSCRLRFHKRGD